MESCPTTAPADAYPADRSLISLLRTLQRRALERADDVAIECGDDQAWSNAELWARTASLALALDQRGLRAGDRVVWAGGRSPEYVSVLLACLVRGLVFVPIARSLPGDVERRLVARVRPALTLRDEDGVETIRRARTSADVDPIASLPDEAPAYIAFTSGSSGEPKGVVVPRRGLLPLARAQAAAFQVTAASRTSFGLAAHFDAAISDVLVPLLAGATLVILPEPAPASALIDLAHQAALTHVDLPPSLVEALVTRGVPEGLRCLVVGGEVAPRQRLRELSGAGLRVVNVYGPTECTVCSSIEVLTPDSTLEASIGAPIPGTVFEVEPASGELLIGGAGVALGYLDDPDRSAEAFPAGVNGEVRCRTGDLVERAPDGSFLFRGRLDRQVQVRGARIEPEEIERAMAGCPGVDAAAVVLADDPPVLVGAFEGSAGARAVLEHLRSSLEPWKQPARLRALPALPRLPGGKVDLDAVRERCGSPLRSARSGTAAAGPLAEAWCRALGVADVHDDDTFEGRGGDSVRALELVVEAARGGIALEASALGAARTFGDLRRRLTAGVDRALLERRVADACEGLPSLVPGGGRGSVLVTGAAGFLGAHVARELARSGRGVIGLVRPGAAGADARLRGAGLTAGEVRPLAGDVSRPDLGLANPGDLEGVTDIVHCAGRVSLAASADELHSANVEGLREVLRAAARIGARVHHVSTLSVFAEAELVQELETLPDGAPLGLVSRIHGGYAASKWVADAVAERAAGPGWTLRPGLLVGAPLANRAPRVDQLSRTVRGLARLGAFPEARLGDRLDITPVDAAARAMARAIEMGTPERRALHLSREVPSTGADLVEAMARAGRPLRVVEHWPPGRAGAPATADVAVALAATTSNAGDRRMPRSGDLFLATGMAFESRRASALEGTGALDGRAALTELDALVRGALAGGRP